MTRPRLIVLSGLPGVGKSSIARELALVLGAPYLGVDACEDGIRQSGLAPADLMDAGYRALWGIAGENLRLGFDVVADCVNPVTETRSGWRNLAHVTGARLIEIEVLCSDPREHRSRVEARHAANPACPDWATVTARHYTPRNEARIITDTANRPTEVCVADLLEAL